MKFTIERPEIDFSYTSIDNIFIEDYMPVANGAYVKVYLYAYKLISQDKDIKLTNEIIAKNLQMTLQDVHNAWSYWQEEQIVDIEESVDGDLVLEFKDLKKLYIENRTDLTIKKKSKEENLISVFTTNERIRTMFSTIDYFMRRQTNPVEKTEILSWITDFNLNPDIIEEAFSYASEKKKIISVKYVRAIVISWYDNNIDTIDKVEDYLDKSDHRYVRKNKVLKKMGLEYRSVSDAEINLINSWYDDYNFSEDIIDEALKRTANVSRPSVNYADAILRNWHELGIEKLEEIEKLDIKPKTQTRKKTGFHNFRGQSDSHSVEDLDEIAKDLMRKRRAGK